MILLQATLIKQKQENLSNESISGRLYIKTSKNISKTVIFIKEQKYITR